MGAWNAATLDERHQLLTMMLDAVYVDMTQGLVLGLKPKPEFLPLFNLGEPVTTGDSELVTGGMEQSRAIPRTRAMGKASPWLLTDMLTKKHNPLRCTPSVGQVWGGIK